jgi:hypothetical protein
MLNLVELILILFIGPCYLSITSQGFSLDFTTLILFLDQKVFIFELLQYLAFQVQHWSAE